MPVSDCGITNVEPALRAQPRRIVAILALMLAILLAGCGPRGPILLTADYEHGGRLHPALEEKIVGDGAIAIVRDPVRAGSYAAQFTLGPDDKRSELQADIPVDPIGSERWYGFSILIPEDWEPNERGELVVQWRSTHDKKAGEVPRSPVLGLRIVDDTWRLTCRWDERRFTRGNEYAGKTTLWTGPFETGRWTDWVVHVRWSFEGDGFVRAWKDGRLVATRDGPNCFNDEQGLFLKWGLYHTDAHRVLYHDELRIGNERATYEMVAPRSGERAMKGEE